MTTAPFVTNLRTNGDLVTLGSGGEPVFHLRVQVAQLWDSVRVDAPSTESVLSVKLAALAALYPDGIDADEFVVRLHGFEILDESSSVAAAGVKDGSILLLVERRRQPVR